MKAGPCPPRPHFLPLAAHPRRQMLKMPHRIPEKNTLRPVLQKPHQCPIRRRIPFQNLLIPMEIRHQRLVDLQDRLRRFPLPPQRLRITKRGDIKTPVLHPRMNPRDHVTERLRHLRQQRTSRKAKRGTHAHSSPIVPPRHKRISPAPAFRKSHKLTTNKTWTKRSIR